MATLKRYAGRNDYYIHAAFREKGLLHNLTYQITNVGIRALLSQGYSDGGTIRDGLLESMRKKGWIYTGQSGTQGTADEIVRFPLTAPPRITPPSKAPATGPSTAFPKPKEEIPLHLLDSLPPNARTAGDVRRHLRTAHPELRSRHLQYLVDQYLSRQRSKRPEQTIQVSANSTLHSILAGRTLASVEDRGKCIIIFCHEPAPQPSA